MQAERTLKFVVVGAAPEAVAIPAGAVLNVLSERDFSGSALDLRALGAASDDASGHVLLVAGEGAPIALRVRGGLDLLSARETEVLRLVAQGHSNPEIAKQLFLGEATVKTHLLHAFEKLEVSDRTRAVTKAMELGLL